MTFKKERKKEIFIHADPMGNRPSCQNPKARLSSELGSEGSAGGSCSQPMLIRQCHVNVEGLWGLRDDPGPRKEQEPCFTPEPQGFSLLDAKVIRKAGQREVCPFVCSCSTGLLARPPRQDLRPAPTAPLPLSMPKPIESPRGHFGREQSQGDQEGG